MDESNFSVKNISAFLTYFQNELSKSNALLSLKQNVSLFETEFPKNPTEPFLYLFIGIKKEKIFLEYDLEIRVEQWIELINIIESNKKISGLTNFYLEYGRLFDDFIEDIYFHQAASLIPFNLSNKITSLIKLYGDLIRKPEMTKHEFDFLLLKSIFLRLYCRYCAFGNSKKQERFDKVDEAERCLIRAEKLSNTNPYLFIVKGHLGFYKATSDKDLTEKEYQSQLEEIETLFVKALEISNDSISHLALLQFYRNTYQFQKCCDLFVKYSEAENNKRRLLRFVYLIGESLFALWELDWPKEYIDNNIKHALEIHTECLDAGYISPRIYLAKACLLAINGNESLSENFIFKIFNSTGRFSWKEVIEFAQVMTEDKDDHIIEQRQAIKKGLNNGYFWNGLGTYAKKFLLDNYTAYEFYETARLLSHNNAIIYNNLAKTLLEMDIKNDYNMVIEYLEKAERYSNRRFHWWKLTKEKFEKTIKDLEIEVEYPLSTRINRDRSKTSEELFTRFEKLSLETNLSRRGSLFHEIMQSVITSLCKIHEFKVRIPYGPDGNYHEVDCTFNLGLKSYLGEFVYSKKSAPIKEAEDIKTRLGFFPSATIGIIFSFSGFETGCINHIKEVVKNSNSIVLIDGNEISEIIKYNCLKQVLQFKVAHLNTSRNPYALYQYNTSD